MLNSHEFKFWHRILDGHLFVVKLYCVFEKTKTNEKEAGLAIFKKIINFTINFKINKRN